METEYTFEVTVKGYVTVPATSYDEARDKLDGPDGLCDQGFIDERFDVSGDQSKARIEFLGHNGPDLMDLVKEHRERECQPA